MAVVAELAAAEVREQLRARRRGQEQVGLAVAVVVGPDGGAAAAGHAGQRTSFSESPPFCSSDDLAAADQAESGLPSPSKSTTEIAWASGSTPRQGGDSA